MSELVKVIGKKVVFDSLKFAEKFEIPHRNILRDIRNITALFGAAKNEFKESVWKNDRNREYPMFLMTRKGFMFLVMNTNVSPDRKSKIWGIQNSIIDAFEKMEELLLKLKNNQENLEWKKSREQGKNVRLKLTDNIKEFVDYATSQGSKNAKMYYANITKMQYKSLGFIQQSKPKLRDTLDLMELHQLILAEDLCKRKIKKYMLEKLHYKEIYLLVKQDIEKFADSLYLVRT